MSASKFGSIENSRNMCHKFVLILRYICNVVVQNVGTNMDLGIQGTNVWHFDAVGEPYFSAFHRSKERRPKAPMLGILTPLESHIVKNVIDGALHPE